jgi:iron complex outermembrane receptor protein
MNKNKMLNIAILGTTALSASMPSLASAQETAQSRVQEPEIIVSATRREEALKDVPMAINVATGEDLQQLNIFDAKDIQQLAPSLELTNTNGRNNVTTLRGITFDPDQGTGPSVRIYLNETPVDAQTVFTSIYDIEQIEVLRGPQGLLRGQSSPAGAITFTTRRPGFDTIEGYAQATMTSRAGYNVQGGVTLPFNSSVSLRLAAVADGNRVNHVRNVVTGDRSYSRTESVRATLGLQPSDSFTAYLTYQYLTADTTQYQQVFGTGNTPSYQLFPFFGGFLIPDTTESTGPALALRDRGSVTEGPARFQNRTHFLNLQASYDLGPATISFVGGHQETTLLQTRDTDIAVPNYQNVQDNVIPYNVDSAELRIDSNNKDGFGWGASAFYSSQTGLTRVNQRSDSFFFPTSVVSTPQLVGDVPYLPIYANITVPVKSKTWSFNGAARFQSGPFKVEGGLRYTIDKGVQQATINISSPGNTVAGVAPFAFVQQGIPPELQASTEKFWTGGANIVYEISPELNVYAAYGRSYRGGS